uniref:ATP synthase F0 subunit 8 n=1 Tax=Lauridromia dehaani TaxID=516916 RepID=UPI0021CC5CAF|nr:ATP synthase F0 subunit 8 [Lauridromia dehaani]UWM10771.1 ATP synthase F0 subunit 8 [Lauridromia dehaani]
MPQMAPLMWFNLFLMFLFSLSLFLIFNHFLKPFSKNKSLTKHNEIPYKIWKW